VLSDLRVLILEDEVMVSMLLEDMMQELGCAAVRMTSSIADAHAALAEETPQLAALDVNVRGEPVFPFADALIAKGVPFVFITGYGVQGLPPEWRSRPVVQKPFSVDSLEVGLKAALGR
jgi:DNA-binding response OmpR family regulator